MKRWLAFCAVLCGLAAALLLLDSGFGTAERDAGGAAGPSVPAASAPAAAPSPQPAPRAAVGPVAQPRAGGVIRGRVIDTAGAGIEGAIVRAVAHSVGEVAPRAEASARALRGGAFELAVSGAATFAVCAEASGFAPGVEESVRLGESVEIELATAAAIDGLVVDAAGAAVAGAKIGFLAPAGTLTVERTAVSDAEGRWRIGDLPPGPALPRSWLTAEAPGFAAFLTEDLGGTLEPGENRYTVVLRRGGVVSGRVVDDATGQPVSGASVALARMPFGSPNAAISAAFVPLQEVRSDESGVFRLTGVPAGSLLDELVWVARANGYAEALEPLPFVADGQESRLSIRLAPAGTVRGRVLDGAGRPVAGARVSVTTWYSARNLTLAGRREGSLTAADGSYRLDDVAAAPGGISLAAVRECGQRGWGALGGVVVTAGETTSAPDLVMRMAPAAAVRVLDDADRPLAGATLDIVASWRDWGRWFADSDGRVLVSFEPWLEGQTTSCRVSARGFVERASDPFVPDPDRPPEVVVRLARAAEQAFHVTWADGSDAANVRVGVADGAYPVAKVWPLWNEAAPESARQELCLAKVWTDACGRCRVGGLPKPPWHAAVWTDPLGRDPALRVESIAASASERELRVEEPAPAPQSRPEPVDVVVEVVDAVNGAPVLDAYVVVDVVRAHPSAPGVYVARGVPRERAKCRVSARDYPGSWTKGIDLRVPGNERIEARLDPGIVVKGKARLPAGARAGDAQVSCSWSARSGIRAAPLPADGEFEIRGVPTGVNLDFLVQIPSGHLNWVPSPFRSVPVPAGARELTVDLDFVAGTHVSVTVQAAASMTRIGPTDTWELTVSNPDGAWHRTWIVAGAWLSTWMPCGSAIARGDFRGADPVSKRTDLTGDANTLVLVVR